MKTFEDFISEADNHPNIDKEVKVSRGIGNPVGQQLTTTSLVLSKLQPIVSQLTKILQDQGHQMRDIEEMLEDGLRQSILATGEEGKRIGSGRTKMSTSEFLKKAEKRRASMEPQGDPSTFGQLPDSRERLNAVRGEY